MTWLWILLAIICLGLLAKRYMIIRVSDDTATPPATTPNHQARTPPPAPVDQAADVDEIDITGESFYQPALIAIFGPYTARGTTHECSANLVADPSNPHDKKAVRCEIGGQQVGYVNKTDAKAISAHFKRSKTTQITVNATVKGGWKDAKGKGLYGVTVELPVQILDPDA